jgi:2'-5' RNA ligase
VTCANARKARAVPAGLLLAQKSEGWGFELLERVWTAALTDERYRHNRVAVAVRDDELVGNVRNHWWWRPGWREGRHFYACHLILDDQPELRALVARYQTATKTLPVLDHIPAQWLHITAQGIGFVDEISPDELDAVRQGIADELAQIEQPTVTFERPTIRPEAVVLLASPTEPLYEVRLRIHRAVVAVLGDERVEPMPKPEDYNPHVTTAYVNSDASAAPIAAALESVEAEPVTVTFAKADLFEFHRDQRMYEWTRATPMPFGTP